MLSFLWGVVFHQQMWILFSIVILFVLCHILRIVLNIEEFLYLDVRKQAKENRNCEWLQYWTITASVISHLLLQINSSINIAIYCYFNHSFREELWGLFRRIIKCSSETITSSNETTNKHYIPSTDNKEIENIDEILPAEPDGKDFKSNAEQIELNIINGGIETAVWDSSYNKYYRNFCELITIIFFCWATYVWYILLCIFLDLIIFKE